MMEFVFDISLTFLEITNGFSLPACFFFFIPRHDHFQSQPVKFQCSFLMYVWLCPGMAKVLQNDNFSKCVI